MFHSPVLFKLGIQGFLGKIVIGRAISRSGGQSDVQALISCDMYEVFHNSRVQACAVLKTLANFSCPNNVKS